MIFTDLIKFVGLLKLKINDLQFSRSKQIKKIYRISLNISGRSGLYSSIFLQIRSNYKLVDDVNFFEYKRPAYIQNPLIFSEIRELKRGIKPLETALESNS
ncbi:hypothetical protein BpHYR1_020363 [Brachionus plicatilis]|uniref:Uncharacterized protein n=1 Tax=Brachionus plicatilis TaxID=10195 RepID=A0A3M7SSS0_BRAPC|nr:hypothetical protein BpHYR1_020363 [Brachionus plicatilis]